MLLKLFYYCTGKRIINIYYMSNNLKRSDIDKNELLKNEIIHFLEFNNLDLDWVSNFSQIIYHYKNNITNIPVCYCGKPTNFKSSIVGYRKTCSFFCSNNSKSKKDKIKETKLEKYGDENYNNSFKVKETKLEKYGDENYNNRESAFKTNEEKYGSHSAMKNKNVIEKVKNTKKQKYGNSNFNNIDKIKEFWNNADVQYMIEFVKKIKSTKLEKYGDENYNNSYKMFLTKIEKYGFYYNNIERTNNTKLINGVIKSGDVLKEWNLYKREVKRFTRINKKKLYEDWDGNDYYDGESIYSYLSYKHTHRFYPTIDHKISVYYGFKNSIDPIIVGSIDNLCITKRFINSSKSSLIESEFLLS
jgi:hypothetical protein